MIIGHKKFEERLKKLSALDLKSGVGQAILEVQRAAKMNCGGFKIPTGELRQSIYTDVELEGDICRGICYTNKKYAPYVEFGTGPAGQESHAGISPDVTPSYNQKGWMMPGTAMSLEKAEAYGFGVAKNGDGDPIGYYTNGQPAHPFMYPALKDNEDTVKEIIADSIRRQL